MKATAASVIRLTPHFNAVDSSRRAPAVIVVIGRTPPSRGEDDIFALRMDRGKTTGGTSLTGARRRQRDRRHLDGAGDRPAGSFGRPRTARTAALRVAGNANARDRWRTTGSTGHACSCLAGSPPRALRHAPELEPFLSVEAVPLPQTSLNSGAPQIQRRHPPGNTPPHSHARDLRTMGFRVDRRHRSRQREADVRGHRRVGKHERPKALALTNVEQRKRKGSL